MADTQMPEQTKLNTPRRHDPKHDPMHLERRQPDPMLDMSSGRRMGGGGMSLVAVAIVVILALVFFGLNGRSTESTTPAQTIPLAAK
jgi:hypothetical protein